MSHDDFAQEPVKGLPELPPEGEHLLWQGRPDAWALTRDSLNLVGVFVYFCFLAVWRFLAAVDLMPLGEAVFASIPFLILGALVCGTLMILSWVQARATVYTITNKRVAMRIGAALTVTLNLPYSQIESIEMDQRKNGTGTIALKPAGRLPVGFMVCWPHMRPWHFSRPEPSLRCIKNVDEVARILADAAETQLATPKLTRRAAMAAAVAAE
jgi:hypothetical protein